ncbi:MAG: type II toxin-antitoxin system Phd/YefM family antitoxin [Pyrinomonadaceae bacterium]
MNQVSVFEGKNKFSELIASAARGEPQIITKNGTATAVVISYNEYKRLTARKETFSEFLLNSPLRGTDIELDLTRSKDIGRPTIDFSEE